MCIVNFTVGNCFEVSFRGYNGVTSSNMVSLSVILHGCFFSHMTHGCFVSHLRREVDVGYKWHHKKSGV